MSGGFREETGKLASTGGLSLFTRSWVPDDLKAIVAISHGYAEHSGRYGGVGAYLAARGYGVHALDYRGHGKSEGERANLHVFRELVTDLKRFVERLREAHPGVPRFILGHSVGALVALQFALEQPDMLDGLVVSASYLENAVAVPPLLAALARPLGRLLPGLPVQALDTAALARDPEVVRAYNDDPLVYHGKVKARMGAELLTAGPYVLGRAAGIELPVLVLHGGEDRIAATGGSRELHAALGSDDKTLIVYEGFYHEILNEPERERVLGDIVEWLEGHLD